MFTHVCERWAPGVYQIFIIERIDVLQKKQFYNTIWKLTVTYLYLPEGSINNKISVFNSDSFSIVFWKQITPIRWKDKANTPSVPASDLFYWQFRTLYTVSFLDERECTNRYTNRSWFESSNRIVISYNDYL